MAEHARSTPVALVPGGPEEPMAPLPHRVVAAHRDTADVVTLDVAPDGRAITDPAPGQFCMLYAPGVGEAPISVSGTPTHEGVLRHTVRDAGAVTRALTALGRGDAIGVRGPYGRGWPIDEVGDRDLLVVAGGIGLAPLRPVVVQALRSSCPHVAVAIGARHPDQLLFTDDVRRWEAQGVESRTIVDAAPRPWTGEVGLVTDVLPGLLRRPAETVAMVCGPEIMMRVTARHLVDAGMDARAIHVSLERNMHCGLGHCGHCQIGPVLTCLEGPVLPWSRAEPLLEVRRW